MPTIKTNSEGYGYKYTDIAGIHEFLEKTEQSYFQEIETTDGQDYVITHILDKDGKEVRTVRGSRVVQATLSGKANPAQEHGSSLTYARRYSLLLAFGLATEDDDAASLTGATETNAPKGRIDFAKVRADIKGADSREAVETLFKAVPANLQQYFVEDCRKRTVELGE